MIDWKRKLSSRKLWAAIVGVVVGLAAAFGIDGNDYAEIAGIVTSAVSVVSYIFAEGAVDKARICEDSYDMNEEHEEEETNKTGF
jgi:uncharacterized membrane protein